MWDDLFGSLTLVAAERFREHLLEVASLIFSHSRSRYPFIVPL